MTPDELYEQDERIALIQEGTNQEIEVVRRNTTTGELVTQEDGR